MENSTDIRNSRRTMIGVVTSNKPDKTVVVTVERRKRHPLYKKSVKLTKKFMAHDESNRCCEGDTVKIVSTRPLSARKRWRVVETLKSVE